MKAPYFWSAGLDPSSREAAPVTRALLTPLSWLYLAGFNRKLAQAVPERAPIPVICIGNLTAGGAGKTPVAEAVRARIIARGARDGTPLSLKHIRRCRRLERCSCWWLRCPVNKKEHVTTSSKNLYE